MIYKKSFLPVGFIKKTKQKKTKTFCWCNICQQQVKQGLDILCYHIIHYKSFEITFKRDFKLPWEI